MQYLLVHLSNNVSHAVRIQEILKYREEGYASECF